MAISWIQNKINHAYSPKASILDVLKENLEGYRKARDHTTVHASDVTKPDFCARRLALLDLTGKKKKDEFISMALAATFDIGNATSDLIRERWAGDSAHGFWECRRCEYRSPFGKKPNHTCKNGGKCDFKYDEAVFLSEKYRISGSIDVFMDLQAPKLFVTELKIIAPDEFEKLAAPLAEHRLRTQLYLKIIDDDAGHLKERINLKEAKVLYVSRAYGKKNTEYHGKVIPFKEFTVQRNDADVSPYLSRAMEVRTFKELGVMPNGICPTSTDSKAKKCSVCTECFSGTYMAGIKIKLSE